MDLRMMRIFVPTISRWSVPRLAYHRPALNKSEDRNNQISDGHESEDDSPEHKLFYPTHIRTTTSQKALLAVGSALMSIADPWRHDMVAVCGETTGHQALAHMLQRMSESTEGRDVLSHRPVINSQTLCLKQLKSLPSGTLGHKYADFMLNNRISADTRAPVKFVDDERLAFVMRRYRESHDLIHCLLGMRTDMLGEVTVKWVEALQTGLPMAWTAGVFGAVRLSRSQRRRYMSTHLPFALKTGHEAAFLYSVYFEKRWHQDFRDLRREFGVPDPPEE